MGPAMDAKLLKAVCNNLERLDGTEITLTVSILCWRWTFSRNGADLKNRENSNMMVEAGVLNIKFSSVELVEKKLFNY